MNAKDLFIVFALAILFAFCTAKITHIVSQAAVVPCEAPEATGWEPPKLQLCPKDMELWDCIRDASYRTDI